MKTNVKNQNGESEYCMNIPLGSENRDAAQELNDEEKKKHQQADLETKIKALKKSLFVSSTKLLNLYKALFPLYSNEQLIESFNLEIEHSKNHKFIEGLGILLYDELVKRELIIGCDLRIVKGKTSISTKEELAVIIHGNVEVVITKSYEQQRQMDRQFGRKIQFVNKRELEVVFSSLIINVESIEKLYPGGYKSFFLNPGHYGVTNGFLYVVAEMQSIPATLYDFIDNTLHPLGFEKGRDYVIGLDENTHDTDGSPLADRPIPWCIDADWIQSIIAYGHGDLVWHTGFDQEKKTFIDNIEDDSPWTQNWVFWYQKHPLLKNLKLKVISSGMPKFCLDSKWFDVVDKEQFFQYEESRIPLFSGSQFGVNPKLNNYPNNHSQHVAVLGHSLLSGHVAGLSIYYMQWQSLGEKLLFIENDEEKNEDLKQRHAIMKKLH